MSVKDFFNNTFKSLQSNSLPLSNIIFISLACIGILACIISSYLKKNIGTAFLVGYCLTFFSIGFVFLLSPNFNYLSLLLPLFLTIAIGGIIYQTGFNLKKINNGNLPNDYYTFSSFIAFILTTLLGLYIYHIIEISSKGQPNANIYRNILLSALLFLITVFLIYTNQIIITKFTTDG